MSSLLANTVIILILAAMVVAACVYIYREKKNGRRCIGCPMSGNCTKKTDSCDHR